MVPMRWALVMAAPAFVEQAGGLEKIAGVGGAADGDCAPPGQRGRE